MLRFTAPAEVNGVALLIHNHRERASDQWMWTPALQRDRRIALQDRSTRFFGTDFSFEDLEERDIEQYDYSMLGSDTIDGAGCWKIEMTPRRGRASQYTRSIAWIRKDNYVLARLDNYVDDQVVKRMTNSTIENVQGIWTARLLEMADLRRSTRTRLTLTQIKYNAPVNERESRWRRSVTDEGRAAWLFLEPRSISRVPSSARATQYSLPERRPTRPRRTLMPTRSPRRPG